MTNDKHPGEPLPIWFFVGVILLVYGLLVMGANWIPPVRPTVLQETHPCLWWGALTTLCGGVFLAIGLHVRALDSKAANEESK